MDKHITLQFIDNELRDLYHKRNELRKAHKESNFRRMNHILGEIEYGTITKLRNLIDRDRYEDWGTVAAKEGKE